MNTRVKRLYVERFYWGSDIF